MKISRHLLILSACLAFSLCAGKKSDIYGSVDPVVYLTGRFDPYSNPLFVKCDDLKIPTDGRPQVLRKEAAEAWLRLVQAFRKDHPGIRLYVCSSTRNFDVQKAIWTGKWTGSSLHDGRRLDRAIPDKRKRALEILRSSSMPGTSRHHWGTDLDINRLFNSYYQEGEGKVLYDWMVKNAGTFGFCQPYNEGRTAGYMVEKWHWSYRPLASMFQKDWVKLCAQFPAIVKDRFPGADIAAPMAKEYVVSVNPDCR